MASPFRWSRWRWIAPSITVSSAPSFSQAQSSGDETRAAGEAADDINRFVELQMFPGFFSQDWKPAGISRLVAGASFRTGLSTQDYAGVAVGGHPLAHRR
jgi:hypothetical protein